MCFGDHFEICLVKLNERFQKKKQLQEADTEPKGQLGRSIIM